MPETLALLEHDQQQVKRSSLHAITAARQLGGDYALLLIGAGLEQTATSVASYGASAVLLADDAALAHPLADRYAAVIADAARAQGATTIVGVPSTFTKDILPRTAALLDAGMLSDVVAIEQRDGDTVYRRPVYAGNGIATVKLEGDLRVLTVRAAAFEAPLPEGDPSPVQHLPVDGASFNDDTRFVSSEQRASDRPDLTEARVVISGGRPLKDPETFERLIGGLADALDGAVGATRAAVDSGMVPNDWQIGQTGKVIAPELYIAAGVSGAIQHSAGIKDARIIVAVNRDAEAPIFEMATYGLVGDLFKIVPELTERVRAIRAAGNR